MWCTSCRQDVPGIASSVEGHYCCARCAEVLSNAGHAETAGMSSRMAAVAELTSEGADDLAASSSQWLADIQYSTMPSLDDWELDEQLKHVERLLARYRSTSAKSSILHSAEENEVHDRRVDRTVEESAAQIAMPLEKERPQTVWSSLVWFIISLSWTALACGGALAGWGWYIQRNDFWNLGSPILFGGQLGLLVGLMLQLLLTVRVGRPSQARNTDNASQATPPATHASSAGIDQRLARMQRQLDGLSQRFDPSGR